MNQRLDTRYGRFGAWLPASMLAGYAVAIGAIIAMALLAFQGLRANVDSAERVTHSLRVIEQLQAILSTMKDAETGQRGFVITGDEAYLEPYTSARAVISGEFAHAHGLLAADPEQQRRLQALEHLCDEQFTELEQTIALRRRNDMAGALAIVHSDRGLELMEQIRDSNAEMIQTERGTLSTNQQRWLEEARLMSWVTLGGSALLLLFIAGVGIRSARDHRARQIESWIRNGYVGLAERLQGERRLEAMAPPVLEYLARYLDAQVGALYIADPVGRFRRVACYALAESSPLEYADPGEGLLGQAARARQPLIVRDIPSGYLAIASGLGAARPAELLIAPAALDGVVHAIVEFGFFRAIAAPELELMSRVSEALAFAVRSSRDRTRLEHLLEETQRQGEELQTQQEELLATNEELEIQTSSLRESQLQLQHQQAALEQTNAQLAEQSRLLERQRDELARAQAGLLERTAELERANRYKSEFLANMSHELRTPLNSALILSRILADNRSGNLSAEQVRYARTIASAGSDLLAIINDVLDLSKIEAGKVELSIEPMALAPALEQIARTFQPLAQQRGLSFRIDADPDAPRELRTDAQRLAQILRNLLSNAVKFTERGGITLSVCSPDAGRVAFAVKDTGIGISEHQQGLIFEAFRQADGSTHRRYGGTGLGLTISRDLARLLGGDIGVESRAGEGSTFTLTLPVDAAPCSGRALTRDEEQALRGFSRSIIVKDARSPERLLDEVTLFLHQVESGLSEDRRRMLQQVRDRDALLEGRRILLVEDDVRNIFALTSLLEPRGAIVRVARNGREALDVLHGHGAAAADTRADTVVGSPSAAAPVDLVLMDIMMPEMDGFTAMREIRQRAEWQRLPIIALTAKAMRDDQEKCLAAGANDYIAKPLDVEKLLSLIRVWMHRQ